MKFRLTAAAVLVYVLWQRLQFFLVFPNPFFQPDSGSYLAPALQKLFATGFTVSDFRSLGYPLFLTVILFFTRSLAGILLVQHLISLLTAAGTAYICWKYFEATDQAAWLIFLLTALLPRHVVYSHTVMSEILYSGLLVLNVACVLQILRNNQLSYWVTLGVGLFLAMWVRQSGKSLVVATIIVLAVHQFKSQQNWKPMIVGCSIFVALWGAACALNLTTRGFWGLERYTGIPLYGTVARYDHPEKEFADPNWVRFDPNGPVSSMRKTIGEENLDSQLTQMSVDIIRRHPGIFFLDQAKAFFDFIFNRSGRPERLTDKQLSMQTGLSWYANVGKKLPPAATLLSTRSGREQKLYPYEPTLSTVLLWPWTGLVQWIAAAGFFLSCLALRQRKYRREILALWLIIALHILSSNLGGDKDGRHAIPLEPLYLMLMAVGVSQIIKNEKIIH